MPQQAMKRAHTPGDVALFTKAGEYVTTVNVPPLRVPAEVIVWGSRVFVLAFGAYREGLAFYTSEEPR